MTSIDTTRADKYEASARAAMAEGFANETRRKQDGLEPVSRAYSELRSLVHSAVWNVVRDQDAEAQTRSYDLDMPFDLHNLRDKHAAYALELAPGMAEVVKRIQALLVLRNEIKAMALLPRKTPKREQVPQDGDKTQERGHCQCCAREHAVSGFVAQHGYRVKNGFFNGVCPGHQYKPMEHDRSVTDQTAKEMREMAVKSRADAERYRTGELVPATAPEGVHYGAKDVLFDAAPKHMQRRTVELKVINLENFARGLDNDADTLQAYADKYHGKPLRLVKL